MSVIEFTLNDLRRLKLPTKTGTKTTNGQLTIIAGSELFHGPALFALKITTALIDMVYFSSPESRFSDLANQLKININNFIWVPLAEINDYITKSQSILIGPGLMRFHTEHNRINHDSDLATYESRQLTIELLNNNPNSNWTIDAGSLQVIKANNIVPNTIITPNSKEFYLLFNRELPSNIKEKIKLLESISNQFNIHIVCKSSPTIISSPNSQITIVPTNSIGLTKGGGGDCLSALISALRCYNEPHLACASADFIIKQTSLRLAKIKGPMFSTDELAEHIPHTLYDYLNN